MLIVCTSLLVGPQLVANWIKGAIKRPGALHKALGVPQSDKIPAKKLNAAAREGGRVGKEASLAKTLKSMHHAPSKHTDVSSDRGTFKHRDHKP